MANNETLRASIKAVLDYLRVDDNDKLRKDLKAASPEQLPAMFFEMSSALADILEDKTVLEALKVRMPDGSVVSFKEAKEFAEKSSPGEQAPKPANPGNTFENKPPKQFNYVSATDNLTYRPSKRLKSNRRR